MNVKYEFISWVDVDYLCTETHRTYVEKEGVLTYEKIMYLRTNAPVPTGTARTYLRKQGVPTYGNREDRPTETYLRKQGGPTYGNRGYLPTGRGTYLRKGGVPTYKKGGYLPTEIAGAYLLFGHATHTCIRKNIY